MTVAVMSRDAQPEGNFKISFNVAFGDVEPIKGKQVVAVLDNLAVLRSLPRSALPMREITEALNVDKLPALTPDRFKLGVV